MSTKNKNYIERFGNSDFAEWIIENRKEAECFKFEIADQQEEVLLLIVRVPDTEDDGACLDELEETFEYDDINDLIEDLFVANEKWTCERY